MLPSTSAHRRAFITGATGFVGSHFLLEHVARGASAALLVRATDSEHARHRIAAQLDVAAASRSRQLNTDAALEGAQFVCGDVSAPLCGVSGEDRRQLPPIDDFWHFAASLDYRESKSVEIESSNLGGTQNAVDLARALGATRFIYISTAYTVGRRSGWVDECLHPVDSEFNNEYERTKCAAEHEVARLCRAAGLEFHIVRPGIVIGTSDTFESGGSSTGLYGLVQVFAHLADRIRSQPRDLVLDAEPDSRVHLIPVDRVVADLLALEARDFAGGPVHHVTARGSIKIRELIDCIREQFDLPELRFRGTSALPRTGLQRLFDRNAEFFLDYLRNPKRFLRRLPHEPSINVSELRAYVDRYAHEAGIQVETTSRAAV